MKRIYLALPLLIFIGFHSFGQTTLTEDANGVLNTAKVVAETSGGQSFYIGHQLGPTYSEGLAIFSALTDNANGTLNYFYDGQTNGIKTFGVRADGQGYFAGNVGIGTTTPKANLHVFGTTIIGGGNLDPTSTLGNTNYMANSGQMLVGWNRTEGGGETDFISNQGAGSSGGFAFYNHDNANNETQLMWILGNGQVMIGNTQGKQGNYLLAVAGSAVATSFTVKAVANWPDYVFERNYQPTPISNLKSYLETNHHLPDVPSADQVAKDGINLGEMDKLLTKKVEELTLYLIEKDKQLKDVNQMINKQQIEIEEQKNATDLAQEKSNGLLKAQQEQIDQLKKKLESLIKSKE